MADPVEIRVPDIGDFEDVEVVEILVSAGDHIDSDEPIISIESDKATMEVPSPLAGEIVELRVSLGDRVSEGSVLATLTPESTGQVALEAQPAEVERGGAADGQALPQESGSESEVVPTPEIAPETSEAVPSARGAEPDSDSEGATHLPTPPMQPDSLPHAGPGVRRFARELGVDLARADGTGPHGRVLKADVEAHVHRAMKSESGPAPGTSGIPGVPKVDFSRHGEVEEVSLPKIRRVAAVNLSRSWLNAPHVTQHDEADVTEMERFRRQWKQEAAKRDLKLSPLHFVLKAVATALKEFPDFRSSLSAGGESLLVKQYFHLGVAVDTEQGLVVPVLRDVESKGIFQLARELADAAERARSRKLSPADMQGAVFTISSLGGIGGTAFTPIVNVPEVSILGLSKLSVQPRWSGGLDPEAGGQFEPRVILPLSLSYDHRVIDGAAAARFTSRLAQLLSDPAYLLL